MTNPDIKLYLDGLKTMIGQAGQAIIDFQAAQKSVNTAMDDLSKSLKSLSQNAFDNKRDSVKTVLALQNDILAKIKETALIAVNTLQEADKNIAAGLDADISRM